MLPHRTGIGIHINCAYRIMPAVLYGLLSPRMTSQKKNKETYDITAESWKSNGLKMEPPRWLAWLEELKL